MKVVYFAHSMLDYGGVREYVALKRLRYLFGSEVVCPNNDLNLGDDINHYRAYVRVNAWLVVLMVNRRGYVGKGVYCEVEEARKAGIPVLRIRVDDSWRLLEPELIEVPDLSALLIGPSWRDYCYLGGDHETKTPAV